jgi:polyhydroxyalkanoate synthase subunit PhaC
MGDKALEDESPAGAEKPRRPRRNSPNLREAASAAASEPGCPEGEEPSDSRTDPPLQPAAAPVPTGGPAPATSAGSAPDTGASAPAGEVRQGPDPGPPTSTSGSAIDPDRRSPNGANAPVPPRRVAAGSDAPDRPADPQAPLAARDDPRPSPAIPESSAHPGPKVSVPSSPPNSRSAATVTRDVAPSPGLGEPDKRPEDQSPQGGVDIERLSRNVARLVEEGGKALAAYLKPREEGQVKGEAEEISEVVRTLGQVAEYWLGDPQRAMELQARLGTAYLDLWAAAVRRMVGEEAKPVVKPDPKDKRFVDPEWSSNQFFDFVKQAYLLTSNWADRLVRDAPGLDRHTRQKAEFYVRQIANAISPSNFVLTNPELLRETFASNAENLVRGMQMLAEDIVAGRGYLKIRQSDSSMFEVGRNLAMTPGKVIYQNDLMQLIQYSPTTAQVLKWPLLIIPPWINKFYILDLRPEKSFIKWCVDQGLTVFVISWVNPDARLAKKSFEQYMREGPFAALDVIEQVTGENKVHTVGYCVGGTLLAVTLAYLAATGNNRMLSATLFAAQVDFTYAGDLMVFVDEEQVRTLERQMEERGFLAGEKMATAFNMLRANDLIWPYVINNYLKGKAPFPFDLLYWNSDATRMPAANHSFYLRNCYLENKLSKGEMVIGGRTLELRKVEIPIYNLATREDHIAPAKSVFLGSKFFGGPLRYILAGSGHIAGVVNPPALQKYGYWVGGATEGTLDEWIQKAEQHSGSWWPDWLKWLKDQDATEVSAREVGGGKLSPIEDAPGSYVRVRD